MNIELNIDKINILSESLKDICIDCKAYEKLCNVCPVNNSLKEISKFKNIELKESKIQTDINLYDLIFDRNKIILAQDNLEEICIDCKLIGIYCKKCYIHKIKREISSLPVENITMTYNPVTKKVKKSCETSCGTSCGTKKKS
jgi:hypothetical protein